MLGQQAKPARLTTCSSSLKKPASGFKAPAFNSSSKRGSGSGAGSSSPATGSRHTSQSSLLASGGGGKSTSRTSIMSDTTTVSVCSSLPASNGGSGAGAGHRTASDLQASGSRKSLQRLSSGSPSLPSSSSAAAATASRRPTKACPASPSSLPLGSASRTASSLSAAAIAAASTARRVPTLAMSLRDKDQQIKLLIKERDEQKFQAEMMARRAEEWEEKFQQSELEKSHVTSEADDEVVELRRLTQELEDENKKLAEKLGEKEHQLGDHQFKLDELECERSELRRELAEKEEILHEMERENQELANGKPIVQVTSERAISKQKFEREIEELKERLLGKEEQMIQLRSSLEMRKQEVLNLQTHSGDLERKLKIESERNERHLKRIDEINLELKAAEAKLATKTEENEMYERQVRSLRQELRAAEEKLEQISLARKKDVDILHSKLSAARRGSTTPTSPQPFKTPTPQDELVRLQMEIRDLKDQLIDREAELDCNRRDLEVMRRKMETRTLEVDCNNQELARRCQDLLEQNRQSEDTVKQLLKSSTEHSTQLMRATEDLKEANAKCIKLREEINSLETSLDAELKLNSELRDENRDLRCENGDLKEQVELLRQQVDSLNEQLSELCEQLDTQTSTLHKDREALAEQLAQNDIDLAQMRQELATAKQDLRTGKLQTQEVASERDRLRADLDMKEKYIASRNDIIETLRHELEDCKKSIADYKTKIEALRQQQQQSSANQTAEQSGEHSTIRELKLQLDAMKRDLQKKDDELAKLHERCKKLQLELEQSAESSASKQDEELKRFDELRTKHSVEVEELKTKLQELEDQLEEAKSATLKQTRTNQRTAAADGSQPVDSADAVNNSLGHDGGDNLTNGLVEENKHAQKTTEPTSSKRQEEYESQIEFLNSVVVDMQRKCDDYKNRLAQIETMNIMNEFDNLILFNQPLTRASTLRRPTTNGVGATAAAGGTYRRDPPIISTATLNRPSNINGTRFNANKTAHPISAAPEKPVRISGRPYCDICNVYDLHHTIYCPRVTEKLTSRRIDSTGGSQSSNSSINNSNNNNNNNIHYNNNNNTSSGINNNNVDYAGLDSSSVDEMFREYEQSIDVATVEQYTSLRRPKVSEKPPRAYCDHCDLFGHTIKSCNSLKSMEPSNITTTINNNNNNQPQST